MLGRSHFKLVAIKIGARDLLSCIVVPVIRNRYYCLFVSIRYYSLFDHFASFLFEFVLIVVRKEKGQF